jgi:hypothetical protein
VVIAVASVPAPRAEKPLRLPAPTPGLVGSGAALDPLSEERSEALNHKLQHW